MKAPVAKLEHLLLATDTDADLDAVIRFLKDVHPEMLPSFRERVRTAKQPPPPPPRPKPR